MANDEIRRVSVEHDDDGKPFFAPAAQADVAATPLDEIRDRELQNLGVVTNDLAAGWRKGWDAAVRNLAPPPEPPPLQTANERKAWQAGYSDGKKHGEQRKPDESKAYNDGYERAQRIYKDRVDRATGLLALMPHTDVGQTVARVADILHGHEDGPELTMRNAPNRVEYEKTAPLPRYDTARKILHNALGVWSEWSKESLRREVQDARDAIDKADENILWANEEPKDSADYRRGWADRDAKAQAEELKRKDAPQTIANNDDLYNAYRRGVEEGMKLGKHAQACDDDRIFGHLTRKGYEKEQRAIGDRRVKRTGIDDGPPLPRDDEYYRLKEQGDRHSQAIDDGAAAHRILKANVKELVDNGVGYEERMDGFVETFSEQADTLRQHDRRLAEAADRYDHLVADLVAARTELRERCDKMERLLSILPPHLDRRRNELLDRQGRAEHAGGKPLNAGEASELRVLNEQVMDAPTGDPDQDRAGRIVREAAQAVVDGVITTEEYKRLNEELRSQRAEDTALRQETEDLGKCFDKLRKDLDEHVEEYARFAGQNQTLAQSAMNAAKGAGDSVGLLEDRHDKAVERHDKADAAQKAHWERTENKVDSMKADVDRLRTEASGARGRAETAVEVAREARRIASNPDGDAGVPDLSAHPDPMARQELANLRFVEDAAQKSAALRKVHVAGGPPAGEYAGQVPAPRRGGMATPRPSANGSPGTGTDEV